VGGYRAGWFVESAEAGDPGNDQCGSRRGSQHIIFVPPPFYSAWIGEATASPLTGGNIAYTLHQYRSQWEAYGSNRQQIQQGLASGQAIVMTEWGDDSGRRTGAYVADGHVHATRSASATRAERRGDEPGGRLVCMGAHEGLVA